MPARRHLFVLQPLRQIAKVGAIIAIGAVAACTDSSEATPRSMVQLLATPDRFDGDYVTTGGFLLVNPFANLGYLYLTRNDAEYAVNYNSILLILDNIPDSYKPIIDFQARYVLVKGKFVSSYPFLSIEDMSRIVAFESKGLDDCRFRYTQGIDDPYPCGPEMKDRGYEGPK